MSYRRPRAIRPGDLVRVIAPAGPLDRERFEAGLKILAERYRPRFSDAIFASRRYLAGDDRNRLADLRDALSDESRAIFTARGGYGSMRLLPGLGDLDLPSKPLVGFSDVTAFHSWMAVSGQRSLHAPVLTQLGAQPREVVERLFHLLERDEPASPLLAERTVTEGVAEGPLLGGNLAVLSQLVGTPWFPNLRGAILLLEDVDVKPYQLDRHWTHLVLAGVFEGVRGIALGNFTDCEQKGAGYSSAEVLDELARALGVPCAADFPIGHGAVNQPVPIGASVRLDATHRRLEFLEPLVESREAQPSRA